MGGEVTFTCSEMTCDCVEFLTTIGEEGAGGGGGGGGSFGRGRPGLSNRRSPGFSQSSPGNESLASRLATRMRRRIVSLNGVVRGSDPGDNRSLRLRCK